MKYKGARCAPLYFIPAILNYETYFRIAGMKYKGAILNYETYFGFSAPQALKTQNRF